MSNYLRIAFAHKLQIDASRFFRSVPDMAEIHQTIAMMGIDEARRQAVTVRERQAVETAYKVLSDDAEKIGFTYSGFALTSLPHRSTPETVWRRESHNFTLLLQSGLDRAGKPIGIPYGSYARFILLFTNGSGSNQIQTN